MKTPSRGRWRTVVASALVVAALWPRALGRAEAAGAMPTLFGLQPFPYDMTLAAVDRVHDLAAGYGTLAIVHRDNGIPWAEALRDAPFPAAVTTEWADLARRVPVGRATYLALAPLAEDRVSLAPASTGSVMPAGFTALPFDDPRIKAAYLTYARRAVARFRPRYLNLGIEAGELAARAPDRWPAFASLYDHVRTHLKLEYPQLQIGISFGLPTLMTGDVATRVRAVVAASDYLGLSFYPYMSPFYERFGAVPLPAPPAQWRDALRWAAAFAGSTPIALCETAYNAGDVDVPAFNLRLVGTPALQEQYVRDLAEIARRDRYLFVAWAIPVDYDALAEKLPANDGRYRLWQRGGLFDRDLQPRPGWNAWTLSVGVSPDGDPVPAPANLRATAAVAGVQAGAGTGAGMNALWTAPSPDRVEIDTTAAAPRGAAMRWSFTYAQDRWQWIVKEVGRGDLGGKVTLGFSVRSDRPGRLFLQLEERGGETFFTMVDVSTDWQRVSRNISALAPDPKKRVDGRLDMSQVVKVLVADAAGALEGARGSRSVWFADWVFD